MLSICEKNAFKKKDKVFDASEFPRSGYTATTARALRPTLKAISKACLPANKIVHILEHKNKPCLDRGA